MPTYRNDSTNRTIIVEGLNGSGVALKPGESSQTYKYYSDADLTKTAEAPRYNPFLVAESATGDALTDYEVDVDENTKTILIRNISSETVTVYFGTKTDQVGDPLESGEIARLYREDLGKRVQKLILTFSGAVASGCTVKQFGD